MLHAGLENDLRSTRWRFRESIFQILPIVSAFLRQIHHTVAAVWLIFLVFSLHPPLLFRFYPNINIYKYTGECPEMLKNKMEKDDTLTNCCFTLFQSSRSANAACDDFPFLRYKSLI